MTEKEYIMKIVGEQIDNGDIAMCDNNHLTYGHNQFNCVYCATFIHSMQETCNDPYLHGCGLPSKETKE